jgi:hypothetical protein
MKKYQRFIEAISLLLVVLVFANGCSMTREIWKDREFHARSKPDLQLSIAPERPLLLVEYTEQFERSKHFQRRAFLMDLEDRYEPYAKPNFVKPADYPGMTNIPVLAVTRGTNAIPQSGYVAIETPNKVGFDLWRDGQSVGRYPLPSYLGDAPVTVETVAKTPLALAVDGATIVIVVAVVVGILAVYSYAESND